MQRLARASSLLMVGGILAWSSLSACAHAEMASRDTPGASVGDDGISRTAGVAENVMAGASLPDALTRAGYRELDPADLPPWFTDEVLESDCIKNVFADGEQKIYFVSMKDAGVEQSISDLFEKKGWIGADNGEGFASLIKKEGSCRWMTVTESASKDERDLVLRIQRSSANKNPINGTGGGS